MEKAPGPAPPLRNPTRFSISDHDFKFCLQIRPNVLENDYDTDSACEDLDEDFNDEDVTPMIPQTVITLADEALSGLPPR